MPYHKMWCGMSLIASAVKHMLAAGMAPDAIVAAVEEMEASINPIPTKRQSRNARYYEEHKDELRLKASEKRLNGLNGLKASESKGPALPPKDNNQNPLPTPQKKEEDPSDLLGAIKKNDGWPKDFFETWYAIFPRKKKPEDARRALTKVRRDGRIPWPDLLEATRRFAAEPNDPKFTPYPATWLNAGSWADEPDNNVGRPKPRTQAERTFDSSHLAAGIRELNRIEAAGRATGAGDSPSRFDSPADVGRSRPVNGDHGGRSSFRKDEDGDFFTLGFSVPNSSARGS